MAKQAIIEYPEDILGETGSIFAFTASTNLKKHIDQTLKFSS